ncbi:hypothetical protein ACTFIW_003919 [Dictyostelium discoideum]
MENIWGKPNTSNNNNSTTNTGSIFGVGSTNPVFGTPTFDNSNTTTPSTTTTTTTTTIDNLGSNTISFGNSSPFSITSTLNPNASSFTPSFNNIGSNLNNNNNNNNTTTNTTNTINNQNINNKIQGNNKTNILFVSNVPASNIANDIVLINEMKRHFGQYGTVLSVDNIKKKPNNTFNLSLTYSNSSEASEALKKGKKYQHTILIIKPHKTFPTSTTTSSMPSFSTTSQISNTNNSNNNNNFNNNNNNHKNDSNDISLILKKDDELMLRSHERNLRFQLMKNAPQQQPQQPQQPQQSQQLQPPIQAQKLKQQSTFLKNEEDNLDDEDEIEGEDINDDDDDEEEEEEEDEEEDDNINKSPPLKATQSNINPTLIQQVPTTTTTTLALKNNNGHKIGLCLDFIPSKEKQHRTSSGDINILEKTPTTGELILLKKYKRNVADDNTEIPPDEIRPVHVLLKVMNYITREISDQESLQRPGVTFSEIQNFIRDRTRSIRQDLTSQHAKDGISIDIHERCTRFHIVSHHYLCELPDKDFNAFQNREQLNNCLTSLKQFYNDHFKQYNGLVTTNEPEFRSYYILNNLENNYDLVSYMIDIPRSIFHHPFIQYAIEVWKAYRSDNYSRFFMLTLSGTYLQMCILHRYFTHVRKIAIKRIARSYRAPKQPTTLFPIQDFNNILMFSDSNETNHFISTINGITIDSNINNGGGGGDQIIFNHSFNFNQINDISITPYRSSIVMSRAPKTFQQTIDVPEPVPIVQYRKCFIDFDQSFQNPLVYNKQNLDAESEQSEYNYSIAASGPMKSLVTKNAIATFGLSNKITPVIPTTVTTTTTTTTTTASQLPQPPQITTSTIPIKLPTISPTVVKQIPQTSPKINNTNNINTIGSPSIFNKHQQQTSLPTTVAAATTKEISQSPTITSPSTPSTSSLFNNKTGFGINNVVNSKSIFQTQLTPTTTPTTTTTTTTSIPTIPTPSTSKTTTIENKSSTTGVFPTSFPDKSIFGAPSTSNNKQTLPTSSSSVFATTTPPSSIFSNTPSPSSQQKPFNTNIISPSQSSSISKPPLGGNDSLKITTPPNKTIETTPNITQSSNLLNSGSSNLSSNSLFSPTISNNTTPKTPTIFNNENNNNNNQKNIFDTKIVTPKHSSLSQDLFSSPIVKEIPSTPMSILPGSKSTSLIDSSTIITTERDKKRRNRNDQQEDNVNLNTPIPISTVKPQFTDFPSSPMNLSTPYVNKQSNFNLNQQQQQQIPFPSNLIELEKITSKVQSLPQQPQIPQTKPPQSSMPIVKKQPKSYSEKSNKTLLSYMFRCWRFQLLRFKNQQKQIQEIGDEIPLDLDNENTLDPIILSQSLITPKKLSPPIQSQSILKQQQQQQQLQQQQQQLLQQQQQQPIKIDLSPINIPFYIYDNLDKINRQNQKGKPLFWKLLYCCPDPQLNNNNNNSENNLKQIIEIISNKLSYERNKLQQQQQQQNHITTLCQIQKYHIEYTDQNSQMKSKTADRSIGICVNRVFNTNNNNNMELQHIQMTRGLSSILFQISTSIGFDSNCKLQLSRILNSIQIEDPIQRIPILFLIINDNDDDNNNNNNNKIERSIEEYIINNQRIWGEIINQIKVIKVDRIDSIVYNSFNGDSDNILVKSLQWLSSNTPPIPFTEIRPLSSVFDSVIVNKFSSSIFSHYSKQFQNPIIYNQQQQQQQQQQPPTPQAIVSYFNFVINQLISFITNPALKSIQWPIPEFSGGFNTSYWNSDQVFNSIKISLNSILLNNLPNELKDLVGAISKIADDTTNNLTSSSSSQQNQTLYQAIEPIIKQCNNWISSHQKDKIESINIDNQVREIFNDQFIEKFEKFNKINNGYFIVIPWHLIFETIFSYQISKIPFIQSFYSDSMINDLLDFNSFIGNYNNNNNNNNNYNSQYQNQKIISLPIKSLNNSILISPSKKRQTNFNNNLSSPSKYHRVHFDEMKINDLDTITTTTTTSSNPMKRKQNIINNNVGINNNQMSASLSSTRNNNNILNSQIQLSKSLNSKNQSTSRTLDQLLLSLQNEKKKTKAINRSLISTINTYNNSNNSNNRDNNSNFNYDNDQLINSTSNPKDMISSTITFKNHKLTGSVLDVSEKLLFLINNGNN